MWIFTKLKAVGFARHAQQQHCRGLLCACCIEVSWPAQLHYRGEYKGKTNCVSGYDAHYDEVDFHEKLFVRTRDRPLQQILFLSIRIYTWLIYSAYTSVGCEFIVFILFICICFANACISQNILYAVANIVTKTVCHPGSSGIIMSPHSDERANSQH